MFSMPLRSYKSDHSLPRLKKKRSFSWSSKSSIPQPEIDFTAFHNGLSNHQQDNVPVLSSERASSRRVPRIVKRDTILLDLSNSDLIPALDYAFAILDADEASTRSLPPPSLHPKLPPLSRGSSSHSGDMPRTPPRYVYVHSPLNSPPDSSSTPGAPLSLQSRCTRSPSSSPHPASFDPNELSFALSQASSTLDPPSPTCDHAVPFPPPASPPVTRIPLLLRKPRMHSPESSIDEHGSLPYRSNLGSSKVSLARSVSSLDHNRDVFGARSTTSLYTPDSALSALLAQPPAPRGLHSPLRLFSSPKKLTRPTPSRRASTPPPSRTRLGIPTLRPPVPALPDVFLLGPAARRDVSSATPSRAGSARTAIM